MLKKELVIPEELYEGTLVREDFDKFIKRLNDELSVKMNVVVTESNVDEERKQIKEWKKASKSIDDERKAREKAILAPFAIVKEQSKSIMNALEVAIKELNKGVEQFDNADDEAFRIDRKEFLVDLIKKEVEDTELIYYFPDLTKLIDESAWYKKNLTITMMKSLIKDRIEAIKTNIYIIKNIYEEWNKDDIEGKELVVADYVNLINEGSSISEARDLIIKNIALAKTAVKSYKEVVSKIVINVESNSKDKNLLLLDFLKENGYSYKTVKKSK